MALSKKQREIIRQDIADLNYLVNKYEKEKQYYKASECFKEMKQLQAKLKGE